jgi:dTDP-4-amino-4,6-dideoxygalactose transaminase
VIREFEQAFAAMMGSKLALALNSGTSTLHSAYFALGVGPGDEVIVPTYTWHASITPVIHCAATPVFCDIDPDTLTIDPAEIEKKITPRTKAICVVHVWGNVCDMDKIMAIANKHNIPVVEDASHAHGATWRGRKVGSIGAIGCFSCQGPKPVSGGEAGVALTNDPRLYDRMLLLGVFGRAKISDDQTIRDLGDMSLGAKYRPHAWAIAMANEDLKRLDESNEKRTRHYAILNDGLRDCPGLQTIEPLPHAVRAGYLEFKFKLDSDLLARVSRDTIVKALAAEGAPITADRYSAFNYTYGLLHTAPLFTRFDRSTLGGCFYNPSQPTNPNAITPSLPAAEDIAQRLLSMYAYIDTPEECFHQIIQAVRKVLQHADDLQPVPA